MLLLQTPGAETRRNRIEAAFAQAVEAGGDSHDLGHRFNLLDTAIAGLCSLLDSRLLDVTLVGYIRGYAPHDPDHYAQQAKTMLDMATMQAPTSGVPCNLLKGYLEDFLALRRSSPEVARYFFKAVTLLWATTVQMGGAVE